MQYKTASARGDTAAQALHLAEDALPGRLYYGLLDLAALPPGCDWADAQTLGTLLYDKAQPAPELSVFVLDTADHSWAADAASLYEDMKAVEREYDLHCGLQQLFTHADGCAAPAYRADSGYDFALLAADGASVYVSGLQAQLAAALCGQTGRFFTAFAGGQAVCDTRVNVTAEDTTVQLHLRDTDFQPLGAYNEDWQALLCTELQQAFSALTADNAADFSICNSGTSICAGPAVLCPCRGWKSYWNRHRKCPAISDRASLISVRRALTDGKYRSDSCLR